MTEGKPQETVHCAKCDEGDKGEEIQARETLPPKWDPKVFSPEDAAWQGRWRSTTGAVEELAREGVGKGIPGRGGSLSEFILKLLPSVLRPTS